MSLKVGDVFKNPSGDVYRVQTDFSSKNAGFSEWGFVERDGVEYFAKRYLSPILPGINALGSAALKQQRHKDCANFVKRQQCLNQALRGCFAAVRYLEFFPFGDEKNQYYYKIFPKVLSVATLEQIRTAPLLVKMRIMLATAKALASFHSCGLIHGDLKPQNVLVNIDEPENPQVHIIDFDGSIFCMEDISALSLMGDVTYYSPEFAEKVIANKSAVTLTHKSDIFSLGVMFYEYHTGRSFLEQYSKEFYLFSKDIYIRKLDFTNKNSLINLKVMNKYKRYKREINLFLNKLLLSMLQYDENSRIDISSLVNKVETFVKFIDFNIELPRIKNKIRGLQSCVNTLKEKNYSLTKEKSYLRKEISEILEQHITETKKLKAILNVSHSRNEATTINKNIFNFLNQWGLVLILRKQWKEDVDEFNNISDSDTNIIFNKIQFMKSLNRGLTVFAVASCGFIGTLLFSPLPISLRSKEIPSVPEQTLPPTPSSAVSSPSVPEQTFWFTHPPLYRSSYPTPSSDSSASTSENP